MTIEFALSAGQLTAISLLAGALVASSSIPAVLGAFRDPHIEHWLQIVRNFISAVGNGIWTTFGLLTEQVAITAFCGVSSALLAILTAIQIYRSIKSL